MLCSGTCADASNVYDHRIVVAPLPEGGAEEGGAEEGGAEEGGAEEGGAEEGGTTEGGAEEGGAEEGGAEEGGAEEGGTGEGGKQFFFPSCHFDSKSAVYFSSLEQHLKVLCH